MPAELISQADPGTEPHHGLVVSAIWAALGHDTTLEGQWRVRIFCDHPPEIRVVVISPQGLTRHWHFPRVTEGMAGEIERELAEWLDGFS